MSCTGETWADYPGQRVAGLVLEKFEIFRLYLNEYKYVSYVFVLQHYEHHLGVNL